MYYIFFTHSYVYGQLGRLHNLAVVKSAAMNIGGTCVFFNYGFSRGINPVVGLLGHVVDLFLVF